MQPADAVGGTGRETAELRMLRRDLAVARARQEDVERYLAEARVREDALRAGGQPAPDTLEELQVQARHLKRALDLCWQQRTSLEVRLADLRVELELAAAVAAEAGSPSEAGSAVAPPMSAAPPPPGGPVVRLARQAEALAGVARRRLRPAAAASPMTGGSEAGRGGAASPAASLVIPATSAAPDAPTTDAAPVPAASDGMAEPLDLSTLRCRSVADLAADGRTGWTVEQVRIGGSDVPVVHVPGARYLPGRGLTIVDGDIAPLEAVSFASNLGFMTSGERGGVVDAAPTEHRDDEVCILSNLFSMTFGHWLDEELPKVFILESGGYRGRYVVCPRTPDETLPGFVHESLQLLGIAPDRIIDRLPGVTTFGSVVLTPPIVQGRAMAYREVYLGFRQHLLELSGASDVAPTRRLWMARGAGAENGRRELVNGAEVIDLLERHGFEIVDMGARPLAEQVRMARSAAVLAGPHGSGMKHALFQAPRSTVIECFTPHHLNTSILNFCRILGHRYHMVVQDTAYTDYRWGLELHVPVEHLALILETLDPA